MPPADTKNLTLKNAVLRGGRGILIGDLKTEERKELDKVLNERVRAEIIRRIGRQDEELVKDVKKAKISYADHKDEPLSVLVKKAVEESRGRKLTKEEAARLDRQMGRRGGDEKVSDLLSLGATLESNPFLAPEIRRLKTAELAGIAGLNAATVKKLEEENLDLDAIDISTVNDRAGKKLLEKKDEASLKFVTDLSRISGSNLALVKAMKDHNGKSLADFIGWESADWKKLIDDNHIPVPEDEGDAGSYAETLRGAVEKTFPSAYLATRVIAHDFKTETGLFNEVMALTKPDAKLVEGRVLNRDAVDWKGMSAADRKKAEAKLDEFTKFSNRYRGLGIAAVANDGTLSRDRKKEIIERRTDGLSKFYRNNEGLDLYVADFVGKDVAFDWTGVNKDDRIHVRRQMMTFQRTLTLTDDYQKSMKLLDSGFTSSMHISAVPEDEFLAGSGLDIADGKTLYRKAVDNSVMISHYFETVRDSVKGVFGTMRPSNATPLVNDLRDIDGYEALFGSQNFCNCDHCRSILSPSAYFVDLMYFVDKHVSKKAFLPADANHPLYLKRRRPDLWTVELNCENTNTLIPYLQIVNEVLEHYLESEMGFADVYETLAAAQNSVSLPFNLYLEELRLYLGHLNLSLSGIYKLLGEPVKKYRREYIGLSEQELAILTTQDTAGVAVRFGNTPLNNFDVQDFIRFAGITREELTSLLAVKSFTEISKVEVQIIEQPADIQLYQEKLKNLTPARLDLIHRFIRLWKNLGWTVEETDLLLATLKEAGLIATLEGNAPDGSPAILVVSALVEIKNALGLSVEELCVMAGNLPVTAPEEGRKGLYDRLFNREKIFGIAGHDADNNPVYNPQATLLADKSLDKISVLMTAGLGVTETELLELMEFLGHDTTVDQTVDIALMSDLYRHARAARGLKLSVGDFIASAELSLGGPLAGVDDILTLIEFAKWRRDSAYAVEEMTFILTGAEGKTVKYQNTAESIAAAVLDIQTSDRPFKKLLLREFLQRQFFILPGKLDEYLAALTTVDLDDAGIDAALAATFTDGQPDNPADFDTLTGLVHEMERYALLWKQLDLPALTVSYVINEKEVFGIADLKALTLADLRNLDRYAAAVKRNADMEDEVRQALVAYQTGGGFAPSGIEILSRLFDQPQDLIQSLSETLTLSAVAVEALDYINRAQIVCATLGIDGHSLQKLKAVSIAGLRDASNAMMGAVSSRYEDEKTRTEKLESLTDKINTRKRDALCDYIIARKDKFKFRDRNDLYRFFLLDVEMGGCFRTSRVVCAISSMQIYINRCLTNLEQSDPNLNPAIKDIRVNPTWIPADEWDWRKNYRVWEANRKVFLYPENYIDPSLRDNKTHLFKQIEDELLQEKITQEAAENAYKRYLSQFAELTRLRYAGAFAKAPPQVWATLLLGAMQGKSSSNHMTLSLTEDMFGVNLFDKGVAAGASGFHLSEKADDNIYYLFARTNIKPYQYYYRTYRHSGGIWGNWIKMDLPIEAEEVSSLMHQGKLYIFWNEVTSKEISQVEGGSAQSDAVNFNVVTKYSWLDENGKWTPAQHMPLGHLFSTKADVFFKSIGHFPPDKDDQDELKDGVFIDYQKKVFRKPYASLTSDPRQPIRLSYIWTQDEGVNDVVYTTGSINVDLSVMNITSGGASFTVTNSQFGESKPVNLHLDMFIMDISMTGQATIVSPTQCIISFDFGSFSVPVTSTSVPSNIFTTQSGVSLSRNEILDASPVAVNARGSYKNINDAERSFLKPEYTLAYGASTHSHYVENNYKSFTQSHKTLTQYPWGDAVLNLPAGGMLLDSIFLGTILTDELMDTLYAKGVGEFLSLATQKMTDSSGQLLDFEGPYGEYYWEIFYHIPFLIANHLNANQKFKEAKWWYERIFNPTSPETPADDTPSDHNWQFREFRGQTIEKLKDILNDEDAIEAYKNDPFNPHAIARLRRSAYQKTIVMHYIDNLIDWADNLFAQDTRESIAEATILYILALNILGERPVQVGECKTEPGLNYEKLADEIDGDSEFLISLEHIHINVKNAYEFGVKPQKSAKALESVLARTKQLYGNNKSLEKITETAFSHKVSDRLEFAKSELAKDDRTIVTLAGGNSMTASEAIAGNLVDFTPKYGMAAMRTAPSSSNRRVVSYDYAFANKQPLVNAVASSLNLTRQDLNGRIKNRPTARYPGYEVVKQSVAAFCVPNNKDLLTYWDRVEAQLYKIRHCMNIQGVRRSLALFQPPIDPMMLVKAKAAGLSMDDISAMMAAAADIPPYRFTTILQSAKQAAQLAQSFGQELLGALEKKDIQELTLLRSTHERNILGMTTSIKKRHIQEAKYQADSMRDSLARAEKNRDHLQSLVDGGLIEWEIAEQVSTHIASAFKAAEGVVHLMAGISYLIPQVGSPFAMKYGGKELGDSGVQFALWSASLAGVANQIAHSAGLEARHQRREDEWKNQLALVKKDVSRIEKQILAADIRVAVAEKGLEIHERAVEQARDLEDFHKNKFTNMGLYNYLASTLNRLYRDIYTMAYDLAKMAERTYQFEIDSVDFFIANDNWEYTRAGLLAGEKLRVQLTSMEKSYLENNRRRPEITQSFALSTLDAGELLNLQQTGTCNMVVPEMAFDVMYPGQYRRLIKTVKLTIPCVSGPYTNVSAKLTLLKGEVEAEDKAELTELLVGKNTSIVTSSGVNDAGMFQFSFLDERRLPFEGAGAISEWRLELPSKIRAFNYNTISDVIMQISYTALDGDRAFAEDELAGMIGDYAATHGMFRLLSLKHEFPFAFHKLLHPAEGQPQAADFTLENAHFPYIFNGQDITLSATKIYLKPVADAEIAPPPGARANAANIVWSAAEDIAHPAMAGNTGKIRGGTAALNGNALKTWTLDMGMDGLDPDALEDVLILVKYNVAV